MSGAYWAITARRWRQIAFVCRYGHQDVYRLLGRDPISHPLTELELALYQRCLYDAVTEEFNPRAEQALVTGTTNVPGD